MNLSVSVNGLQNSINSETSQKTVLTSSNVKDENSFSDPDKVMHFPQFDYIVPKWHYSKE